MAINNLASGGKERQIVELLKGFRNTEVQCLLVMLEDKVQYREALELGVTLEVLERKGRFGLSIFRAFNRLCSQYQPDIIQAWDVLSSFYSCFISRLRGIKFINFSIQYGTAIPVFSKIWWISRFCFPLSDIILANSFAGLRSHGLLPNKKRRVIHNGFDLDRVEKMPPPEEIRSRFGVYKPRVVGMVASFTSYKDYPSFISAALNILNNRNDVCFVCVGDGADLPKCLDMVPERHKSDIFFLGRQEDVESIVNIFDIGVLATFTEGISNSALEYMALRKPVIVSRGGGSQELVIDGETGFLIDSVSPEQLQTKIEFLLANPLKAQEMGEKGFERLRDNFSLQKMTNEFIELYREILCVE